MRKRYSRDGIYSLGFATLYCNWLLSPLIDPKHLALYHWGGDAWSFFLPRIVAFVFCWSILFLLVLSTNASPVWNDVARSLALYLSPWLIFRNYMILYSSTRLYFIGRLLGLVGIAAFTLWLIFFRRRALVLYTRIMPFLSTLMVFCAFAGFGLLAQATWLGSRARGFNRARPASVRRSLLSNGVHPRIIWIIFDELSFSQIYGHRLAGLRLEAFDRLQRESTVFGRTVSGGNATEKLVPGLFTGQQVTGIRSTSSGKLLLSTSQSQDWLPFHQQDTVFSDAKRNGYHSAVAGWYNPYCRMLSEVVDSCFWASRASDVDSGHSVWKKSLAILTSSFPYSLRVLLGHKHEKDVSIPNAHIEDYQGINDAGQQILEDPAFDFLFLHLPLPHPGGIYDRKQKKMATSNSSYIDNLALADIYLQKTIEDLQRKHLWDSSAVIIMGDHGWRIGFWKGSDIWTAEDEAASHNEATDQRPAMIVKLPGQRKGARIDEPFRYIQTRKLMNAFFKNEIMTSDDLHEWVRQNP